MSISGAYRRGISIVAGTVLLSSMLALALVRTPSALPRAAEDLGSQSQDLGRFQLVERSGRGVTEADLAARVSITSFIFTRCQLSCPRISSVMKSLQAKLEGTNVLLVSLSVDPEHDTPVVLQDYAQRFGADPDRWWFLTGERATIYELVRDRFKLSVMQDPTPDPDGRSEAIAHSDRLALVDHGKVVGLFDSNDPGALETLVAQATRRATPRWIRSLPAVNASLNALCALFLIQGWLLIRRSRPSPEAGAAAAETVTAPGSPLADPVVRGHILCMTLAVLTSALFLSSYLVYHYHAGSVPFKGSGLPRWLYFTVLISHTLLATFAVVPLVILTLALALRRDFARHKRVAATTLPIWIYVSITGVVIYLVLYHLPLSPAFPPTFGVP